MSEDRERADRLRVFPGEGRTLTSEALYQIVAQNHEAAEDGHARLRGDYRSLEARMLALERGRAADELHFARIDDKLGRPMEVSALRFTPQMVTAIIAIVLGIAGGWGTTILVAQQQAAANQALKESMVTLTKAVETVQRQTQLQDLKIQDLKEALIKLSTTTKGADR